MSIESNRTSKPRAAYVNNNLKFKGCGRINCRSCLGTRNSVRKEILKILVDRFRCDGRLNPEHPASEKDFSK